MKMYFAALAAVFAVAGACSTAHAQLRIEVTGVPNSGQSTWTFFTDTSDLVTTAGTIRTPPNNTFSAFDSGQFPFGQNTILDSSFVDVVFPLSGSATITIGGETQSIAAIYLDDDGTSADDLGVRAAVALDYAVGEASSWSGSGTVPVDITAFVEGSWSINSADGQAMFFADPVLVNFTQVIPEPTSAGFLLGGACLLVMRRRR